MPTTKEGTSSAAGQTEAGFWAASVEGSTARLCRGYGPCPSRTAAGDTNTYRLKAVAVSLPIEKENSTRERPMRSCPTHKCVPQRNFRVQTDRRRRAFWAVSAEKSTARHGPCPCCTPAGDTDSELQHHPFPLENKTPPDKFTNLLSKLHRCHEGVLYYHGHHTRLTTKE